MHVPGGELVAIGHVHKGVHAQRHGKHIHDAQYKYRIESFIRIPAKRGPGTAQAKQPNAV